MTAPAALLARYLVAVPYVVFAYGQEIRSPRWRRLVGYLLRNARLVVACSNFTRSEVLNLAVLPERVRVIYPGVDAQRFSPDFDGPDQQAPRTLLTVARLTERNKGHDTTIRALPAIKAKCPDVRYVIVGDGPLRPYLEHLTRSIGVEREVVFLGEVSSEVLDELYRSADALVLPSRETASDGGAEGFGIVFLEAAACAKPVVAGKSGGINEAVQDGVTGILVDPDDVGAVAGAVISVLRDRSLAKRLGEAGRERVVARFTWDRVIAEARGALAEIVGDR